MKKQEKKVDAKVDKEKKEGGSSSSSSSSSSLSSHTHCLLELIDVVREALPLVVDELLVHLFERPEGLRGDDGTREDAHGEDDARDAAEAHLGVLVRGGGLRVQLAGLDGEDVSVSAVVFADVSGGAVEGLLGLDHQGHAALGRRGPVSSGWMRWLVGRGGCGTRVDE